MSEPVIVTSQYTAAMYLMTKCVARKGIGSYFCIGECIYNRGTTRDDENWTFTVKCANPKQKPIPFPKKEGK